MRIIECEQGSMEWFQARRGIPSASNFDRIITPKTGKLSAQADDYICELIGELNTPYLPEWAENYTNKAIRWGEQTEQEARDWYTVDTGNQVRQVGFCTTDDARFGCSPDGLIGEDGGLELKCPQPKTHTAYLLKGGLPDEYRPQVHGALFVTGRPWWDFASYSPGLPPLLVRVVPDDYTRALADALENFHLRYSAALEKVRLLQDPVMPRLPNAATNWLTPCSPPERSRHEDRRQMGLGTRP